MSEKKMQGFRARLDYVLKHNYFVFKIFNFTVSSFFKILSVFVRTDKHIIVFNGLTRKYSDSPRCIYEYMLKYPDKYGKYKCIWGLEDPDNTDIPGNAIKIKVDTLKYFIATLKAKYWVACVNIERGMNYKRKGCKYLNTWHGTPIKHVGNDAGGRKDFNFCSVDFFCYASEYEKDIYKRAFRVKEDALIPTGLPRNEELYKTTNEEISAIRQRLGLPLDKKVILYAPTWRDSTDNGKSYSITPPINANRWESELKDNYVVLFRMHAYTNKLLGLEFNDTIRDFSNYPNVNDLFKVADILISDYSASIIDYSIMERPILCFAYDYEEYKKDRGLYLDYTTEIPSGILKTEDDVLNYLKSMDYKIECVKTKKMIKEKFLVYGGDATKKCIEILLGN